MPIYEYHCPENGLVVEVNHPMDTTLTTWLEVCYVGQQPVGETDPMAPVHRVLWRAPAVSVTPGVGELTNLGFTKLVKREDGVYENVTADRSGAGEPSGANLGRIVKADDD